jgi:subtilisin family serine protease
MQEPRVDFYFEPRRNSKNARRDGADTVAGLTGLPAAVLQRHGALVLDPDDAAAIPGQEPPRPTVYRARTLLIPGDVIHRPEVIGPIKATVLAETGIELVTPSAEQDRELTEVNPDVARELAELPYVVVLRLARPASGKPAQPQVIDAWVVLQTLRAAVAAQSQRSPKPDRAATEHKLDQTAVNQIALEHLLISSAINGSPAKHGGGAVPGGAVDSSGTGPSSTDSYVFNGGDTRLPVAVCLDAPKRLKAKECKDIYGRRPTVAVLDTGVRAHWWLDVKPKGGGYELDPADGFVEIDKKIQGAIYANGQFAAGNGDRPRQMIASAWDKPVTADPLVGELDSDTGHSTFISGIVRQVAPDARVLAVRVMHPDGLVYEGDLLTGLRHLAKRVALAEAGDMTKMVDVLSLSLGYFSETEPKKFTSGLRKVLDVLARLGVVVAAAAGNYATSRRFYPAAFAELTPPAGAPPLVSVGALNPNGSKAMFSDGGRWITAWASGAIMISTFPTDIQGSRTPELKTRAHPDNQPPKGVSLPRDRESLDFDNYHGGFAAWSGTSFSAPLVAAHVARALLRAKQDDPELWLPDPGHDAARRRALAALTSLKWPG